jgi:hypothetical protein
MEQEPRFKTLRDEIAIEVLKFLLALPANNFAAPTVEQTCKTAYGWADETLRARDETLRAREAE